MRDRTVRFPGLHFCGESSQQACCNFLYGEMLALYFPKEKVDWAMYVHTWVRIVTRLFFLFIVCCCYYVGTPLVEIHFLFSAALAIFRCTQVAKVVPKSLHGIFCKSSYPRLQTGGGPLCAQRVMRMYRYLGGVFDMDGRCKGSGLFNGDFSASMEIDREGGFVLSS